MGFFKCLKTKPQMRKALGVLFFSVCTLPAVALDLGRLQVLSAIGEPLLAEIDVVQASPDELRTLRAQLAAPSAFSQAGMEYNPALSTVTASLQTRPSGGPYIALKGRDPIQDNFVDLILETQTSTGQLVKNFALLLNSVSQRPENRGSASAPATAPQLAAVPAMVEPVAPVAARSMPAEALPNSLNVASVELNSQNVPVYRFASASNAQIPAPQGPLPGNTPASASPLIPPAVLANPKTNGQVVSADPKTIKVKSGDTASQLALRYLGGESSLDQMMLAMLKANPDAFIQGNVNLIKAGAVIRIPDSEEATEIPRDEARKTVIAQSIEFAEYARRLAETPLLVDAKNSRVMSGKVTTESEKSNPSNPQQDKLTLSKSSVRSHASEANLAREREAKEAEDQLAALNQNMKDLEALAQKTSPPSLSASTSLIPSFGSDQSDTLSFATMVSAHLSTLSMKNLSENSAIWVWAAALLSILLMVGIWMRRKSSETELVFVPSYEDIRIPDTDPVMDQPAGHTSIPAQMSAIDLNLHASSPPGPQSPSPQVTSPDQAKPEDTEQSKLNLATQLMAKGDQDLARALILSVISSTHGDIKDRAIQMLGQIR